MKTPRYIALAAVRTDAADMLKRRLKQAGLLAYYPPHLFRATMKTRVLGIGEWSSKQSTI